MEYKVIGTLYSGGKLTEPGTKIEVSDDLAERLMRRGQIVPVDTKPNKDGKVKKVQRNDTDLPGDLNEG